MWITCLHSVLSQYFPVSLCPYISRFSFTYISGERTNVLQDFNKFSHFKITLLCAYTWVILVEKNSETLYCSNTGYNSCWVLTGYWMFWTTVSFIKSLSRATINRTDQVSFCVALFLDVSTTLPPRRFVLSGTLFIGTVVQDFLFSSRLISFY